MLRFGFIAGLLIEERKIRVDLLFGGAHLLGLVTFGDGPGIITFAVEGHAEPELGIEMVGIVAQDGFEFRNGIIELALSELVGRFVISVLQ